MSKKLWIVFLAVLLACAFAACGEEPEMPPMPSSSPGGASSNGGNTSIGGGTQTGQIYLGIVGFSTNTQVRSIGVLSDTTKNQYLNFIDGLTMGDATALYYGVDTGLRMLDAAILPSDLVNASMVTFTDGFDTASRNLALANFGQYYATQEVYRDALKAHIIASTNFNNKTVSLTAYSIGLSGDDVKDNLSAFDATLLALASHPDNKTRESSMALIEAKFSEIATNLTKVNESQAITLRIANGINSGTRMRFTFNTAPAASSATVNASTFHIDATFVETFTNGSLSYSLQDIECKGFTSVFPQTMIASRSTLTHAFFTFDAIKTSPGNTVVPSSVRQWYYMSEVWQADSEFGKFEEDVEVTVTRSSAVVMLVLDCTESLGAAVFAQMKTAAKSFINTLIAANSDSGGASSTGGGGISSTPSGGASSTGGGGLSSSGGGLSSTGGGVGNLSGTTWNGIDSYSDASTLTFTSQTAFTLVLHWENNYMISGTYSRNGDTIAFYTSDSAVFSLLGTYTIDGVYIDGTIIIPDFYYTVFTQGSGGVSSPPSGGSSSSIGGGISSTPSGGSSSSGGGISSTPSGGGLLAFFESDFNTWTGTGSGTGISFETAGGILNNGYVRYVENLDGTSNANRYLWGQDQNASRCFVNTRGNRQYLSMWVKGTVTAGAANGVVARIFIGNSAMEIGPGFFRLQGIQNAAAVNGKVQRVDIVQSNILWSSEPSGTAVNIGSTWVKIALDVSSTQIGNKTGSTDNLFFIRARSGNFDIAFDEILFEDIASGEFYN